jgi:hypothetical protein
MPPQSTRPSESFTSAIGTDRFFEFPPETCLSAVHQTKAFRSSRADRIAQKPTGGYREEKQPGGSRPFLVIQRTLPGSWKSISIKLPVGSPARQSTL